MRHRSRLRPAVAALAILGGACLAATPLGAQPEAPLPRRPLFGAVLAPVPDSLVARFGAGAAGGVVLQRVDSGTTAHAGGLRAGDVLVAIDTMRLAGPATAVAALRALPTGATFVVRRARPAGGDDTLRLVMRERPRDRGRAYVTHYDHVVSRGARLRTMVTEPTAPGPHPVLVLLGGIGGYSVDGPLAQAEYGEILHDFAERGWVTVRVEKPGIGDSEGGPFQAVDFDATLDAYRAAYASIPRYAFADTARIHLFGHSMGGVYAPLIAADPPAGAPRPRGVIAAATQVRTWTEYWLENARRQLTLAGQPPAAVETTVKALDQLSHYLVVQGIGPDSLRRLRPDLAASFAALHPDGRTLSGQSFAFWHQLARRDLAAAWSRVDGRVLTLHGEADFVAPREDHPLIARIVNAAHPGRAVFRELPDTDHGFLTADTPEAAFAAMQAEAGQPPGTASRPFNAAVLAVLREWLGTGR